MSNLTMAEAAERSGMTIDGIRRALVAKQYKLIRRSPRFFEVTQQDFDVFQSTHVPGRGRPRTQRGERVA